MRKNGRYVLSYMCDLKKSTNAKTYRRIMINPIIKTVWNEKYVLEKKTSTPTTLEAKAARRKSLTSKGWAKISAILYEVFALKLIPNM
jgi:hypothetical protein